MRVLNFIFYLVNCIEPNAITRIAFGSISFPSPHPLFRLRIEQARPRHIDRKLRHFPGVRGFLWWDAGDGVAAAEREIGERVRARGFGDAHLR